MNARLAACQKFRVLLALLLSQLNYLAFAGPLAIDTNFEQTNLVPHLRSLVDIERSLEAAEVFSLLDQMQPSESQVLNYNYTQSVIWLHFQLNNLSEQPLELVAQIQTPWLDYISLYRQSQGNLPVEELGHRMIFYTRTLSTPQPSLPINLGPGESEKFLIRVQSSDAVFLPITLKSRAAFEYQARQKEWLLGAFYGLLAMMFIYNLVIFLFTKRLPYLIYSLNIFCWFFLFFSLDGYSKAWLWPAATEWPNQFIIVIAAFTILVGSIFTMVYLRTDAFIPSLHRILKIWAGISLVMTVANLFIPYYLGIRITIILSLFYGPINIIAGYLCHRAGSRMAKYYLAAWFFPLSCSIVYILGLLGIITVGSISGFILHFGVALGVILLSIALGMQLRLVIIDREGMKVSLKAVQLVHDGLMLKTIQDNRVTIHSWTQPSETVGGDWYICLKDPEQDFVYAFIGDITGHGIATSLLTAVVIGSLETSLNSAVSTRQGLKERMIYMCEQLNQVVLKYGIKNRSMLTMAGIGLDLTAMQAVYLNAGHVSIIHKSGAVLKPITMPGSPLGLRDDPAFGIQEFAISPGDFFVMFTDGLIDQQAHPSTSFNIRSLLQIIRSAQQGESVIEEIKSRFRNAQEDESYPIEDDCTALCIEFNLQQASSRENASNRIAL